MMIVENGSGSQLAKAAAQLIGVKFLLHGRSPREGIDCVGLVAVCLRMIGKEPAIPSGYRLRNSDLKPWLSCADKSGLTPTDDQIRIGDILLISPGPGQHHLVIAETPQVAIHAHAGVRKVVRQPMPLLQMKLKHWRLP